MGTAMMRRHWGESLEFVASSSSEYHWVNGNILQYAGPLHADTHIPRKLELLDVDAHSTTSLLAPRAIFVTNGTDTPPGFGDAWADPRGTFLSGKLASPVWELLGWRGQVIPADTVFTSGPAESIGGTPPFNVAFIDGTIGWRRQIEGHVSTPNWPTFAIFAARYLNDHRPTIAPYQRFKLGEAPVNIVGRVVATDADASDNVADWQIKGGSGAALFDIDAQSGEITIAAAADIDFSNASYALTVIAGDGNLPSHDAEVTIKIPDRINVCHQGRTVYVPKHSVPKHLSHGDAIGGCLKQ
jgi:hypothetical protein